ncbi:outer membrane receptor protein involved in Fe transport [Chitinophaga skermanii]|uniref:Outer membrane receptor protein involved in Fe transport n=1 Tax=Chitinophaga skermanii TaxID=331697 RepID=A0A327QTD2_9BACT|nr:TonB-dependent receptor [Chitinophaga skermanii]RAJ06962.1 outer membrane receptor protein involved in Fe transport [Chitinophaga skermanii]
MKSTYSKCCLLLFCMLLAVGSQFAMAQEKITLQGTVVNKTTGDKIPGVSVAVKGSSAGTVTNNAGEFKLSTSHSLPLTLTFTYVGFTKEEVVVTSAGASLQVQMTSTEILGQEVVVSASRVSQNIMESPVSIEKINTRAIRETPAMSFYNALTSIKGVESSTQSLTFNSITTRGFNSNGNTRFNQFMDGMDNQAPGLNFSVGNILGMNELDVDNVELLPGASSALYGAGGTNGTLLMTSKNPYDYQGLSLQIKAGMNHVGSKQGQSTGFIPDLSARYAKSFGKFAFKVGVSYMQANDWQASDSSNINRLFLKNVPGYSHKDDPNYDGINIYGDEINANMHSVGGSVVSQIQPAINQYIAGYTQATGSAPTQAQINAFIQNTPQIAPYFPIYAGYTNGLLKDTLVSRTGYKEKDLVDYDTRILRTNLALHYRFTDHLELIAQGHWGKGTSVYTGADRYSLSNFNMGQYKLELRGKNFYVRGYTTQERSGDSYNATALASIMNETWKASTTWFPQYVGAYSAAKLQGATDAQAHAAARNLADQGRFTPGSKEFNDAKEAITNRYIGAAPGRNGAKFNDKTNMYHYEGMYNFSEHIKIFDLQVGASFRRYALASDGTIFDDETDKIKIDEYGGFLQIGKKLLNDKIALTGSVRYDKNENFEGRFTPRLAAVFTVAPQNNIRLSFQTGFRNPTTQNQYIDLLVRANTTLIGGLPSLLDKYQLRTNTAYTQASVQQFQATGNPAVLKKQVFGEFKPESVKAFEIGYRGLLGKRLLIDAYYYFNSYTNFVSTLNVLQTPDGTPAGLVSGNYKVFSTVVNNPDEVKTQGFAIGLDYVVKTWQFSTNTSYNKISKAAEGLYSDFNTPDWRFNVGVGNRNVYKNVGFNVTYRWQNSFRWTSTFAVGDVPAFGTLDAQVNYKIPTAKAMIKLGASNLLNNYYITSFGNPSVGGVYYVALQFDGLFAK